MEMKDRLVLAMRESGFESPTDAWRENARALGISKDLVISNCNGHRPISKKSAAIYAKVFGHTPGWYLFGTEDDVTGTKKRDLTRQSLMEIFDGLPSDQKKLLLDVARNFVAEAPPKAAPRVGSPEAGPKDD